MTQQPRLLPTAGPPPDAPAALRRGGPLTALIWLLSLVSLLVGGILATLFVMMPVSLDPGEMIAAGTEPWVDAAYAALGYGLLVVLHGAALVLWHRSRRRTEPGRRDWMAAAAWVIAAGAAASVALAGTQVWRDWL